MYINLIGTFSILTITCLCGFIAFAYYFDCDPKLNNKIQKYDQVSKMLNFNDILNEHGNFTFLCQCGLGVLASASFASNPSLDSIVAQVIF